MGVYLNPNNQNFTAQVQTGTYIDKTMLIEQTNKRLNNADFKFVCISRPRRFGKSIAEDMIAANYSKGADSAELFAPYKIVKSETFAQHLNKYNVVKVDLNARYSVWSSSPTDKRTYPFIGNVSNLVGAEFRQTFSDIDFGDCASLADYIQTVYTRTGETFIIIIDEYDVLIREQVCEEEFKAYLGFLNSLFKNAELKPAITLAYLTGILPIMKDKIQSKLNTFDPITMLSADGFAEFTGFTEEEVRALCERYGRDFVECKSWYDGYEIENIEIYNPQAVIKACLSGKFTSYWSATSSYEVVADKLRMNFAGTKESVISMMAGNRVDVDTDRYDNTMTGFKSSDDVFTYLIHLGYLAYDETKQQCYIPNREIRAEWIKAIEDDDNYAETDRIIKESKQLLKDTIDMNEFAVAEALDNAHIHVSSIRNYNNEYSLHAAIYLSYIYAINNYVITKELPTGKGVADIAYIPFDKSKAAIIVELKVNQSPETALNQIKQKKYFASLDNWHGDILFVGVSYDKETKQHWCKIEQFVKE